MLLSTLVSAAGLLAGVASAAPRGTVKSRQAAGARNAVYWGQNSANAVENNDLSTYCTSTSGIDVLILAFMSNYPSGTTIPYGTIGQSCSVDSSGNPTNCAALGTAIATCQQAGIKVLLSLGGEIGNYALSSQSQAESIAQYLWNAYGNSGSTSVTRPFGNTVVDGFDLDIEVDDGSEYYQYMISTLRSYFANDSSKTYYITGAPQCPLPDDNMGVIIQNSVFDFIWVQWYNQNPTCGLGYNGAASFNYDSWVTFLDGTPSANAKLFVGAPASTLASTGSSTGSDYYVTPDQLATIVNQYKSQSNFGGVMLWDAAYSDQNVINGCTYAQEVHAILVSGSPCVNGPVSGNVPAPVTTTATTTTATPTTLATVTKPAATTASSASGSVQQWGQCGGEGYTGPTACVAPYTCIYDNAWWSSCN